MQRCLPVQDVHTDIRLSSHSWIRCPCDPHKAQGTMEKRCWKECMKQEVGRKVVKCRLLGMNQPVHWWYRNSKGCVRWVCAGLDLFSSVHQTVANHRSGRGPCDPTSHCWTMGYWDKHPVQMDTHLPYSSHGRPDGPSWSQWVTTGHRKTWKWERDLWEEGL